MTSLSFWIAFAPLSKISCNLYESISGLFILYNRSLCSLDNTIQSWLLWLYSKLSVSSVTFFFNTVLTILGLWGADISLSILQTRKSRSRLTSRIVTEPCIEPRCPNFRWTLLTINSNPPIRAKIHTHTHNGWICQTTARGWSAGNWISFRVFRQLKNRNSLTDGHFSGSVNTATVSPTH